jgi:hypothetical protein
MNAYGNTSQMPRYDEDGNYIDPKISHLDDQALTISAENARIMMAKGMEESIIKDRRRVFRMIHVAIKNGKTKVRLETHTVKSSVLPYFSDLGYTITTVTPNAAQGGGFDVNDFDNDDVNDFDNDGDEIPASGRPYFYYNLTWADANVVPESGATVTSIVPVVSGTAEVLASLSTEG